MTQYEFDAWFSTAFALLFLVVAVSGATFGLTGVERFLSWGVATALGAVADVCRRQARR